MSWVLYGATGYTGRLIAEHAVRCGERPLLAARSLEKLKPFAQSLGLDYEVAGLDDGFALRRLLKDAKVLVHAAGPFVHTARPMVEACLDTRTHYLDLTGEVPALELVYSYHEQAKARGVTLVPGGGFDVVPSDCLAAHVAEKVPHATSLDIDILTLGAPSGGTLASALGMLAEGGQLRRGGQLVHHRIGKGGELVRFTQGSVYCFPAPLGDLASAYRTTGIPDITTRLGLPRRQSRWVRRAGLFTGPLELLARTALGVRPLRTALERRLSKRGGADAKARARGEGLIHVKASGPGGSAEGWLETPDGYDFTCDAVLREVEALCDAPRAGALTPSQAFGKDFVLPLWFVRRFDELTHVPENRSKESAVVRELFDAALKGHARRIELGRFDGVFGVRLVGEETSPFAVDPQLEQGLVDAMLYLADLAPPERGRTAVGRIHGRHSGQPVVYDVAARLVGFNPALSVLIGTGERLTEELPPPEAFEPFPR